MRNVTSNAKEQQRTLVRSGSHKDLSFGVDAVGEMSELLGVVRSDSISQTRSSSGGAEDNKSQQGGKSARRAMAS
jgi:hypothetical protein